MTASTSPAPRVFVAASHDTALGALLDSLRRAGIDGFVFSEVAPLGADRFDSARFAVDAADLVVVVLTKRPALDPIFEAGMAAALGKRLVLVSEPGAQLPADLRSFVLVQASPGDLAPVVAAIQEVARRPPPPDRPHAKASGRPLDIDTAARLLRRLDTEPLDDARGGRRPSRGDRGHWRHPCLGLRPGLTGDIGVWSDDLFRQP